MLHYGFNLAAAMAGDVASTPALVLAMLRNLPEGSRYVAIMSAPGDDDPTAKPPLDPELEGMLDRMTWTEDRRLVAQLINQVNFLIEHSIQWKDDKGPGFAVVGPAEWRQANSPNKQGPKTIADLLTEMGHIG